MKISKSILAFATVALLFGAAGCSEISDIEDRLDTLESRVDALEKVLPTLNGNIEALSALAGGGTINKVEEKNGVYTITLSNGEQITVDQGNIGVANPPVMSLDKDGYWMVDYGKGAEYLLIADKKVNATGEDGVTPVFGVDAEGFWTISYDNGATYTQVLGADEKPVAAVPQEGADQYFANVVYNGQYFSITLKDGKKIILPVVSNFFFSIEAEGVQSFKAGETKIFKINSEGVVSATVIAKPSSVEVSLDDKSLVVRAVATKAISANSSKDIAVLALSAEGFATIAKMQVTVEGVSTDTTPRATVAASEATSTSLTFAVALDNSESYKYMILSSTATAPTAESILADGTDGSATSLVVSNLTPSTEYTLYVLPLGTNKNGVVATAKSTTLAAAPPTATVTAGTAAPTSLEFTIALSDATAYKYMIAKADEEAPTAEQIKAEGVESTETTLVVTELESQTDYVLYVLPLNGETLGAVVSTPASTTELVFANNYERYQYGMDLIVGHITLKKSTHGDATLIDNTSEVKNIAANGVYFIASDATDVTINGTGSKVVILSLDENMATVKRTEDKSFYLNASKDEDYLIMSNIKYETVMTKGNMFGIGGEGVVETIFFNKCKIEVPGNMNMLYSTREIKNFNMTGCDIRLHKDLFTDDNGTSKGRNILQTNTESTYETLVFTNNIFYCTDGDLVDFRLFANNKATITLLEVKYNTIAAVYCNKTLGYITANSIKAGEVSNNLLYLSNYTTHLDGYYIGILHIADKADSHLNMPSNLAFYNYDAAPTHRAKVSYYSDNGKIYSKAKANNPIPNPDYVNGVFTAVDQGNDKFSTFGAKR